MIDGHHKPVLDRFWDHLGRALAARGVSANAVTVAGTLGVIAAAAAYPAHRSPLVLAGTLLLFELSDFVDGAVARAGGSSSARGAYLDAVTDRYKEIATWLAVAWVHELWVASLLACTGGLVTSYNKARAAMERPLPNEGWPDLFERMERVGLLLGGLAFDGLFGGGLGVWVAAWVLAVGTHLTAVQRFWRGWGLLAP